MYYFQDHDSDQDLKGKASMKKKTFSFGHCPKYLTPPPLTPIRATWSSFFYAKNDVLRVWQEKKIDADNDGCNDNYDDNYDKND